MKKTIPIGILSLITVFLIMTSLQTLHFISTCCTKVKCLQQVLLGGVPLFCAKFWQIIGLGLKLATVCLDGGGSRGAMEAVASLFLLLTPL